MSRWGDRPLKADTEGVGGRPAVRHGAARAAQPGGREM
jgi:hypothetical protein